MLLLFTSVTNQIITRHISFCILEISQGFGKRKSPILLLISQGSWIIALKEKKRKNKAVTRREIAKHLDMEWPDYSKWVITHELAHQLQLTRVKVWSAELRLASSGITHISTPAQTGARNSTCRLLRHRGHAAGGDPFLPILCGLCLHLTCSEWGRGACWAATQICLTDGMTLDAWEGPGTRQMAPGTLGFFGRASGKLSGLRCPTPFLK